LAAMPRREDFIREELSVPACASREFEKSCTDCCV
jgi:hypothetical protein